MGWECVVPLYLILTWDVALHLTALYGNELVRHYFLPLVESKHWELPDVQTGFRKGRETRDQIGNICWIIKKARKFQIKIYFCLIDYAKAFDCVDHNKLWEILQEMGTPDHLTCLLRSLYAGQEATVRTGTTTLPFCGHRWSASGQNELQSLCDFWPKQESKKAFQCAFPHSQENHVFSSF